MEAVDERLIGLDLNADGELGMATRLHGLPPHFAGAAAEVPVRRWLYPLGTEFLHTLRYLDPGRLCFARGASSIEDVQGRLRLQTQQEQQFCMGCHSNLGVTVDGSFAFVRKSPGAFGLGPPGVGGAA
ncbi:hypothetical protein RM530_07220 [Algiphilus sp. W345]|uniref:Uncharacterized protein n=1 Tax=Banduia mediterranea TaxID=3075609 RepID=A0ABU2WH08_9GAMM|nr:hypothetical protein [Algiphilus sp. W345]MDT0497156.1 hypothetical protein [Algiphilus sp. W345]